MKNIRISSVSPQYAKPALLGLILPLLTKSAAMGLLPAAAIQEITPQTLRVVLDALQGSGLIKTQRARLQPLLDSKRSDPPQSVVTALAETLDAIEHSPTPEREWSTMREVFGEEQLAELTSVSVSSLKRYLKAERPTPGDVADRLHYLAMIVADLSGSYNELGIQRWFERPRAQLENKSPRRLLGADWNPGSPAAQRIRDLAKSLSAAGAT